MKFYLIYTTCDGYLYQNILISPYFFGCGEFHTRNKFKNVVFETHHKQDKSGEIRSSTFGFYRSNDDTRAKANSLQRTYVCTY